MENSLTVSVIIPTYNRAKFIGKAIQSVLDQTYSDYEIIVIDDGSTDNTKDIIETFDDARIRYVYQENKGVSAARNAGIRQANGDYIAFLDSDDEFLPEKLEKQVNYLQNNPTAGMVACYYIEDYWKKSLLTISFNPSNLNYRQWLFRCQMATPAVMVRKDVLDKIGYFDETLSLAEDIDLWIRIAEVSEIGLIKTPLAIIHFHQSNTPKNPDILKKNWFYIKDKHFARHHFGAIFKRRVYARTNYVVGNAFLNYTPPQISQGYNYYLRGVILWPFDSEGTTLLMRLLFRTMLFGSLKKRLRGLWQKHPQK